ncbi:MAG: LCP family protein [Anaerolineaceae bacterium]|nr:LCP family protein [Anaerolineaceae bacterium]
MRTRLILSVSFLILTLASCNFPAYSQAIHSIPQTVADHVLVTADPNATPTATPFQPGDGTLEPGAQSTITNATPLPPRNTPIPPTPTTIPLINRFPRPDGQVNILIFGSDYRPESGYRTDVIMLLSLNTKTGKASLISFPRDLYVDIPGWEMQRLNTAQAHGGFELTQKTFELNFGVHPDFYIMTNFQGFKGIIDTLGGINVYAARNLSDTCDLPQKAADGFCSVGPGWVTMNGDTALWYARARHSTSDFDRTRRAQEVIQAVFVRLLNLNAITRGAELYKQFRSSVETNITLQQALDLLPLATKLADLKGLTRYAVSYDSVTSWKTPEGAQVLLPHTEDIFKNIIAKAVYGQ